MSDAAQLLEDAKRLPGMRRAADKIAAADRLVRVVRNLALRGIFQPKARQLTDEADLSADGACRTFKSKAGLLRYVAGRHAGEIVDSLGLSSGARISLSPRDERAIAMAVLGGCRLEAGE